MSPRRTWLLAWLGGPLIGIANGTLRELAYKNRVGELTAHQLSTGSAIALFAGYFELLERRRPLTSTREALQVGAVWLALTIAFEFGFGRGVAHTSWDELLADYDVRKGRLWPLVLAWILLGPAIVRAGRERRGKPAAGTGFRADAGPEQRGRRRRLQDRFHDGLGHMRRAHENFGRALLLTLTLSRALIASAALSLLLSGCGHQPKTAAQESEADALGRSRSASTGLRARMSSPARCWSPRTAGCASAARTGWPIARDGSGTPSRRVFASGR